MMSFLARQIRTLLCLFAVIAATAEATGLDPAVPTIAAPEGLNVILVDESTVEFSWNEQLLDGSQVTSFNVWDRDELLANTRETTLRLGGIDRNANYDFSVSAITASGEETRRSSRVYYDLPQLDPSAPDGGNRYLPPLENLQARVLDNDRVELTWTAAAGHWSWAEPSEFQYRISIGGSSVDVVDDTRYVHSGLAGQGLVWLSVSPFVDGQLYSRQPNLVLVDTTLPAGTVIQGYPGFNSLFGLRADVYSSTTAELFWQASQFPTTSHVYVNGKLVERLHNGYSVFLSDLVAGESIQVSVGQGWPYDPQPPFDWPLLHDYPLMHVQLTTPPDPYGNTDDPGPVTGLRADVYSTSAAEIFWDRSDAPLARYRIYKNNDFLIEIAGTSWFLGGLPGATETHIAVAAIGPSDIETESTHISFRTPQDASNPTYECSINGLRAEVYSSTAAEIFWERNSSGTRYDILLDGSVIENTDAVSWFNDEFESGSTHRVQVNNANEGCEPDESSVEFRLP